MIETIIWKQALAVLLELNTPKTFLKLFKALTASVLSLPFVVKTLLEIPLLLNIFLVANE